MHHGYWNDGPGGGGWWWVVMIALMALFWIGLVWFGVTLLHRRNVPVAPMGTAAAPPLPPPRRSPQSILAERLAKGEIDPDEYRLRLHALDENPPPDR